MDIEDDNRIPQDQRIVAGNRMARRALTGEKVSQIARDTGISRQHLYSLERKYNQDPTMKDQDRSGRPPKVSSELERRIVRGIKIHPFKSSSKIAQEVNAGMEEEEKISPKTVRVVAIKNGYYARRPLAKPVLTKAHITTRYTFAALYQNRTMHFWQSVLFMDETQLRLCPQDLRKKVRRQEGKRLDRKHLVPRVKFGGGGVMYWGCVSWSGPGPLVAIDGALDGETYAEMLEQNIPGVIRNLNVQTLKFIEDHAPIHRTQHVIQVKQRLNMRDLDLPPNSPDINVIENVWSIWKTKVAERGPNTRDELRTIAAQEWRNLPVETIRCLIRSMPDRLGAIVSSRGGNTKY